MIKQLSSPSAIHYLPKSKLSNADVLVIPVSHVFNSDPEYNYKAKEVYVVDGHSNILPYGRVGIDIRNQASDLIAGYKSDIQPKILVSFAKIGATAGSMQDDKRKKLLHTLRNIKE